MKLLYLLLTLFLACNLSPENKTAVTLDKQTNKDTIIAKSVVEETFLYSLTPEDLNFLADKNYKILISKIIKKKFDFFNIGFIDTVVPFQKCIIKNYGRVEIYSTSFSEKLPETFKKKAI